MKTEIIIILLVLGTLLVAAPAISDYSYQRSVVDLLNRPGVEGVNLEGQMGDLYRFGCWSSGSSMIAIAVLSAIVFRERR